MALNAPKTTANIEQPEEQEQMTQEGVEASVEEQVEQSQPNQEVTETQAPSAPAKASGGSQFESGMAEDGFEGLTLGGLSFEQIRLPGEGQFLIGQDDEELGKEFDCVVQTTRSRFIVRQSDDDDAEMFYSYDPKGQYDTEGVDMTDTLQEWKEEGFEKPVIKKYLEVMAIMIDEGGDRDRMMVMLSIPPASVQKISGFFAQQQLRGRGKPNEYVTKFQVAKKVKKGNNSWFPWAAAHGGEAPELF